jgi:hypothetical protein
MTEDSFAKVKKLMKIIGGKALIVENDEPTFVIINVDDYSYGGCADGTTVGTETQLIEKINKDITIWKNKQKEKEMKQMEKDLAQVKTEKETIEIVEGETNL